MGWILRLAIGQNVGRAGYNSHASGVQSARKLLNVAPAKRPTAIFASNDEMAAGALTVPIAWAWGA